MRIKNSDLIAMLERAIEEHQDRTGLDELDIRPDLYWIIPDEYIFDMDGHPKDFEVGSYSDEIPQLQKWLTDEEPFGRNGLQFLASILRYMSTLPP